MKKTLMFVLAIGLFVIPAVSRAAGVDDVRASVRQSRQISRTAGQVLGASTNSVGMITKTLRPGVKNPTEVMKLQMFLKNKGLLNITPDGNYGPRTEIAVKQFQTMHGLPALGNVGPQTLTAINQNQ